jgi:hypothetical protein
MGKEKLKQTYLTFNNLKKFWKGNYVCTKITNLSEEQYTAAT